MKTIVLVACLLIAGCAAHQTTQPASTATIPPESPDVAAITRGQRLVEETKEVLPAYVGANLTCSSCHIDSGRYSGPLTFAGILGQYPQFSDRTHHVISLRDRIAECFFYSMNGRPPPYYGRELVAIEAYIGFLSRGSRVDPPTPAPVATGEKPGDAKAGATLYAAQCVACHGANGAGNVAAKFPPLWGPTSFNDRAGMTRVMAAFVRANMPYGNAGSLSAQQAADVSAYILSHPRPHFDMARLKDVSATEAAYFR
jgi:thiosulfate dehydrogenase